MISNDICPIGNTLDLFNRKWIFCIMSNIFRGMTHFNEFKDANPTISNHVLAQTLKYMEENDLINKIIGSLLVSYVKNRLKEDKIDIHRVFLHQLIEQLKIKPSNYYKKMI